MLIIYNNGVGKMQKEHVALEQEMCENLYANAEKQLGFFQIELEDFLNKYYRKDYSLDFRVKTADKMMKKLAYRRLEGRVIEPYELPDIIGFRVAVASEVDVIELSNLIEECLKPLRKVDHFSIPTTSGFKANLYYFSSNLINVEIQVMTQKMKLWVNETHDEYDRRKYKI